LNIESGGEIIAEYAIFEYMSTGGVNVKSGAFVDPAYSFNNCTFRQGEAGGTLLTINNDEDITVNDIIFPNNTWGSSNNVTKTLNQGHLTFVDFYGDFSGEAYENDVYNLIDWDEGIRELDLKVFLEGPFNTADMDTDLNIAGLIPLSQPYNTSPWNYAGSESVASIPNTDVIDWVLVEIRDATDAGSATPATISEQHAAFLLNNGLIVDTDGSSILQLNNSITHQLFVVLWHRNHLGIMSASGLVESGGVFSYDFTTGAGQAYNSGQKDLGSGVYGMFSADANADGDINTTDKTLWETTAGKTGYLQEDFNLDGQVNNPDKNEMWVPNEGEGSQVPE